MKNAPVLMLALLCAGCSVQNKLDHIRKDAVAAAIAPSDVRELPKIDELVAHRDTLTVTDDSGREVLIMKAAMDENGDMVATDVITAAKVTARFRNIAERHGKVTLNFDITVPREIQDSRWQVRLHPDLFAMGDSTRLESVMITGSEYRKAQLKGYQQYEKFLSSIITDTARFRYMRQLELFLERNLPEIYRMKSDSSEVDDETVASLYGVSEKEAVNHYTKWLMVRYNQRKISLKDKYFRKYVKSPILQGGFRLDTVLAGDGGELVYRYSQTIPAAPGLRKAEIMLSGEIYEQGRQLLAMPPAGPLTFYISSLSTLVDDTERYVTRVIERKASADASFKIEFRKGQAEVDRSLGENAGEIGMVEDHLLSLLENRHFDLDSIIVSSSCSPEGGAGLNRSLSQRRSDAVAGYFGAFLKAKSDSLRRDAGVMMDLDGNSLDGEEPRSIPFISRSRGEDWEFLESLVERDSLLTREDKARFAVLMGERDPDGREALLQKEAFYPHVYESLYPRLRKVSFDFRLHRKGMVKDTVHTTEIDSVYLRGVEALKAKDYKQAADLLRPYRDYNTAVAYCALDYDATALSILEELERNDRAEYLLAILYSRKGDHQNAVQCYLNACAMNGAYVSRGNLDPEISELINTYGLNKNL